MRVKDIIKKFGRTRAEAARRIGKPYATVDAWERRGGISRDGQKILLNRAKQFGIPLSPEDFFVGEDDANGSSSSASVVTDRPPLAAANHEEMFE